MTNKVNHAKSNELKARIVRKEKDDLMERVVALFHAEKVDSEIQKNQCRCVNSAKFVSD